MRCSGRRTNAEARTGFLCLQRDGKRQDIGVGSANRLSLAEARLKAGELRKAIKIDRRDVLAERKSEAAAKLTFRAVAEKYHEENAAGWKSAVYARQWLASLENHAFPNMIRDIDDGLKHRLYLQAAQSGRRA